MSAGSGDWYIRGQGRVLGPFNWSQLVSLRDRGHLTQVYEVSQDRRSWTKAADMPGLYAQSVKVRQDPQSATPQREWPVLAVDGDSGSNPGSLVAETGASWYIARGDTHFGPLQQKDLQRMIDTGEVGPNSLVWKDGMADWVAASQVPELRFTTSAGAHVASTAGQSAYSGSSEGSQLHPHQSPRTSGFAVASLVLGVVWLCGLGSLLATIFGIIALNQIFRSNGTTTGKGLALSGLILGIIGLVLVALSIAFGLTGALLEQAKRAR
jgi:hypothetical protein